MSNYTLYGFLYPKPEKASELKKILLALVEPTRQEVGSIHYDIYEEADGTLFIYEVWRSKKDFDRHMETPHMKHFLETFWNDRSEYLQRDVEAHQGQALA